MTKTFSDWIEEDYRQPDEPVTTAISRLALEMRAGYRTLFYAYKGARVGLDLARRIDEKSRGIVKKEGLVFLPTIDEVIERERAVKAGSAGNAA